MQQMLIQDTPPGDWILSCFGALPLFEVHGCGAGRLAMRFLEGSRAAVDDVVGRMLAQQLPAAERALAAGGLAEGPAEPSDSAASMPQLSAMDFDYRPKFATQQT